MARKNLIRQSEFPYHVFIRSNNRDWFQIPLHRMWELFFQSLLHALDKTPVKLHAFVLMGNHYHILLTTPGADLDKFMEHFNKHLSRSIKKYSGAENHKFANRYKWCIVQSKNYLYNIYRYIYQNPIRAKLCRLCIDYPYSSLRLSPNQMRRLGITQHICYYKNRIFMEDQVGDEYDEVIRKALNKRVFSISTKTRIHIKNQFQSRSLNC